MIFSKKWYYYFFEKSIRLNFVEILSFLKKILFTQSDKDTSAINKQIIEVDTIDCISINNLSISTEILAEEWIIISSKHAVESLHESGIKLHTNIACVGSKTAKKINKYYNIQPQFIANSAEDLLTYLSTQKQITQYIYFCGNKRLPLLPQYLKQFTYREIICYTTTLLYPSYTKAYDGILFFSPSAVNSFLKNNTITTQHTVFALGKTTESTLIENNIKALVPTQPTIEHITQLINHFYNQ